MSATISHGHDHASVTETSYRAAVVHDFHSPLAIEHVARAELAPDQIRVQIEACGLCHTDIHAAHGDWPVKPEPPFVPGHEGVGRVVELGSSVTEVTVGERVAMPWLGYACGTCEYCISGRETLCLSQRNTGYSFDGGFGEYATAYGRYVVSVPDGITSLDAAPLTCAGVTTYKAVKVAGTRSSDLVAVFGVGGLGHLAIQYAKIAGGRVIAVDVIAEKLALARELGAEFTVDASREDPVAAIQRLGGADQAIALAVSPRAFEQAYGSLRRGGTLVFVALPADNEVTLPIFETVLNGITDRRLDRRHAAGPAGGVRAPCGRADPGDQRDSTARRRQRGDRGRRGRACRRADRARAVEAGCATTAGCRPPAPRRTIARCPRWLRPTHGARKPADVTRPFGSRRHRHPDRRDPRGRRAR